MHRFVCTAFLQYSDNNKLKQCYTNHHVVQYDRGVEYVQREPVTCYQV